MQGWTESMREPRVAFVNLGCRVNRVEVDDIAAHLESLGAHVSPLEEADAVVINTCAVTGEAETKTRKAIRHAAGLPGSPQVFATGCVVSLFADEVSVLADNVTCVADKTRVAYEVASYLGLLGGDSAIEHSCQSVTPTGRTRPGIKVQDGCDNRCTYCIVWKARGPARSITPEQVIASVREQLGRGAREVVLTGINLGRYESRDACDRPYDVTRLLQLLLDSTDVGRIRLSSIEPQDVSDDLLRLIGQSDGRVAPFLHIPLQAGCDATLRRMERAYDTAFYLDRVNAARDLVGQDLSLGCDLIVGFPGETDDDFATSLALCEQCGFTRMHVFRYSKRPGTPAASMDGQIPAQEMSRRAREARELARRMRLDAARARVGNVELVTMEYPEQGVSGGLFDVHVAGRPGELLMARIIDVEVDALQGVPIGVRPDGGPTV
ncbi:MAG: MiaB/RimO family radical SAM methylthiotransferase [Atopobiaceae bacterium]|nr:MiaB/RimO family radical SAM methylthiotransferase [Atopobiaceae bacterium]